ncbi:MAG: DnaB-like helicase C-terminal domain-containing protein [Acidimicrobiales bacterium]
MTIPIQPLFGAAQLHNLGDLLAPENVDTLWRPVGRMATGFDPLDTVLEGGIQTEELIVVGGLPGIGKTISLVQWTRTMAKAGITCAVASYEHRELALLCQLLLLELGELPGDQDQADLATARRFVAEIAGSHARWSELVGHNPLLSEAASQLQRYAGRIQSISSTSLKGGLAALEAAVTTDHGIEMLVVDHLQKVPADRVDTAGEIAAALKRLAVENEIAILAAAPIGDAGLQTRRLRLEHLRNAAAVSHEADVVIILNDKLSAVSRAHSTFDSVRAGTFKKQTIFSIEKNRRGAAGVDLEFQRDFLHRRFDPQGRYVSDALVDGVMIRD